MTEPQRPRLTLLQRHAGHLLWLGVACLAGGIGFDLRGTAVAPGTVDVRMSQLTAPASTRVIAIHIRDGQRVAAGDPVIELDSTEADLELAHAQAELERVRVTVTAREADVEGQDFEFGVRLATEHERASMALTSLVGELKRVETEFEGVGLLLERQARLVSQQLQSAQALEELKLRRAGLEQRVAELENGRKATEKVEQAAGRRLADWKARHGGAALTAPERAAVLAQEERVKRARWFKERFIIRAPITGRVAGISVGVGDVVAASTPLAFIADAVPTGATAWVPEELAWRIEVGDVTTLRTLDGRNQLFQGKVRELGVGFIEAPARLRQLPGEPFFARPVYIDLDGAGPAGPLPGQTFEASFSRPAAPESH